MVTHVEDKYELSNLSHRKLSRELLKAFLKYSEIEQRRWQGDYSDDVELAFPFAADPKNSTSDTPPFDLTQLTHLLARMPETSPGT